MLLLSICRPFFFLFLPSTLFLPFIWKEDFNQAFHMIPFPFLEHQLYLKEKWFLVVVLCNIHLQIIQVHFKLYYIVLQVVKVPNNNKIILISSFSSVSALSFISLIYKKIYRSEFLTYITFLLSKKTLQHFCKACTVATNSIIFF